MLDKNEDVTKKSRTRLNDVIEKGKKKHFMSSSLSQFTPKMTSQCWTKMKMQQRNEDVTKKSRTRFNDVVQGKKGT